MPAYDFAVEQIIKVHDGDTCTVLVDLGFGAKYETDVRIEGIDAPEISKKESKAAGQVARDILANWLGYNLQNLRLFSKEWDKYGGRALGTFYLDGKRDKTASAMMVDRGVVKVYNGEKKSPWTAAELKRIADIIP